MAEAKVFQLPFELPHAQTVCQGRENIQCFFGKGTGGRGIGHLSEILHGARAQGEFNQDDTDVGHHRQQHFTHGFGLLGAFFGGGKGIDTGKMGEFLDFVYAVNELADGGTALFANQGFPVVGIGGQVG